MGANILLFVCSNILGAIDFHIADRKQRRSVLETRQSLEVKLTLESENLKQVCSIVYSSDVCPISLGDTNLFLGLSPLYASCGQITFNVERQTVREGGGLAEERLAFLQMRPPFLALERSLEAGGGGGGWEESILTS